MGDIIRQYTTDGDFPDLDGVSLAILGVTEDRNAHDNDGCSRAPDEVRKYLYELYPERSNLKMADLGNIKRGYTTDDTYFALSSAIAELLKNRTIPIIIGGSQDLTYANYLAYESIGQIINLVSVDPRFDLGSGNYSFDSQSYLSRIILHQPNYLFNFSNIGYQTYYNDQEAVLLMKNLLFDVYRLGKVRAKLEDVEPIVRDADMLSFDVSSIRFSDAPGHKNPSPNGFYGEEVCQITRYAGLSEKLTSIGFYELNPDFDSNGQTAHLVAEMIWYFIDGFCNRPNDHPKAESDDFLKYRVSIRDHNDEIIFFKSLKTERWWMEVTCPANVKTKYERHYLVPCSYADYQVACADDIPDRWWQVYQKFM